MLQISMSQSLALADTAVSRDTTVDSPRAMRRGVSVRVTVSVTRIELASMRDMLVCAAGTALTNGATLATVDALLTEARDLAYSLVPAALRCRVDA